ncbi:MAG: oligosaccharide flippase family protein [Candidatus Gracilibacteria bacterium]
MKVIKNSIIYLSSSILNKAVPFLLLPIMTKYLTPEDYGILSIYTIFITLFTAFIGMNLHSNISKNFFKTTKQELSLYIGNIFIILSFTFISYLIITYFITLKYETIFSIPSKWILLIPFISMMMMVNEINTTILRNEQRAYMFGIFEISNTIVKLGITLILLLLFGYGWYSPVLGVFTSSLLFFFIGIFYIYKQRYLSLKLDKEKVKSILNISVPLIPHLLGGVVIAMSDRLFIEKMVSIKAVGIYSVGYMFGMVVMLFTDAFIKAWSPWFYKNLSQPTQDKKEKIVKYTYLYIFSIFGLAIFISFLGELILPYFVDSKFYGASKFILWVSLGYAVRGTYQIFFPYLVHINKTAFLGMSTIIAAILNLVFNYIFIKYYGTIGAAYATALAFAVSAVLVFWYQNKHYKMPWNFKKVKKYD